MYARYKPPSKNIEYEKTNNEEKQIMLMTEQKTPLLLNDKDLVHVSVLGGGRFGKSTLIKEIVLKLPELELNNEKIIFNDSKDHDFLENFYCPSNSIIISDQYIKGYPKDAFFIPNWFREIALSHDRDSLINLSGEAIFRDAIAKSSNQFFPKAARQIVVAYQEKLYRDYFQLSKNYKKLTPPSNLEVVKQLLETDFLDIIERIREEVDLSAYVQTVPKDTTKAYGQFAGITGELSEVLTKVFSVRSGYSLFLNESGKDTIRDLLKNEKIQYIFLEAGFENRLRARAIYSLILELISYYKLSTNQDYIDVPIRFILDEVSDLGKLESLEPLINKGSSKGVSVILSLQSIAQLYQEYGENVSDSILGSISKTLFCFHSNEPKTLQFVSESIGKGTQSRFEIASRLSGGRYVQVDNYGIETKDITSLGFGEFITKKIDEVIGKRKLELGGC